MNGQGLDAPSRAPDPPEEAELVFGQSLPLARRYADLLATTGISHGLVGPREAPRLWERHLVNCAVMETLVQQGERVVDIGSGAGLPGLVLAIVRPDLDVHLVEPLLRRTTWLSRAVDELGLENVTVHRGRADEVDLTAPVVTARAVASLDKLVAWSFPLLAPGGRLLALKGEAAAEELRSVEPLLLSLGVTHHQVRVVGVDRVSEPARVVEIVRPDVVPPRSARRRSESTSARARRRSTTRER
ncbi:16S rRNA (guanine(527)-N(7))-methyltransferase RsmG [Ornithinimicrobium sp. LYQ121]|uniref:16S rRNA (guanine(527)-N(7))-methyltransferase RsmG n=1 Tax=Ornithinimicrobium sp. LYQ121 TaxID=3378801 RepID=UPI0038525C76